MRLRREAALSASVDVCGRAVANVIHQVSGQSDPPLNDWLLIRLTGRPPPHCLLPATSSFVIYFHLASLVLPPTFLCSFHQHSHPSLSALPPLFPSFDRINTSFCLCLDHITCGQAAHDHTTMLLGSFKLAILAHNANANGHE